MERGLGTRIIHTLVYDDVYAEHEPVIPTVELIEYIKGDGKDIPNQVDQWRRRYQDDKTKKAAVAELLILAIEACCGKLPTTHDLLKKYQIERDILHHYFVDKNHLLDSPHVITVMSRLTKLADIVNVEDYISSEIFQGNLQIFWKDLVNKCDDGPLFDGLVFEKCMDFMIQLSRVSVYCCSATRTGLQLLGLYIDVASSARFKDFAHNIVVLERMIMKLFQGIFVTRYRDDDIYVRMVCMEALQNMIVKYPSKFRRDLCLPYLGWALIDKSAHIRKASIRGLELICKVDGSVESLGLLTGRISTQITDVADDISTSVVKCAIDFVIKLLRPRGGSLDYLYDLLKNDPASVEPILRESVSQHLLVQDSDSSQSTGKGDGRKSFSMYLLNILDVLRKLSKDRVLINYVIEYVWMYMAEMEDWNTLLSLLRRSNLNEEDITNLVWLLNAAVKKTVGERIVCATDIIKPSYSEIEKEQYGRMKNNITRFFVKEYASLLNNFLDPKAKIAPLIEVILYLDLKQFKEKEFEDVLNVIKRAFLTHNEKETLRICMKVVVHCISNCQGELQECIGRIYLSLQEDLYAELVKSCNDHNSFLQNLKRLYELQLSSNVDSQFMAATLDILKSACERYTNNNEEVVSFLLFNLHMSLRASVLSNGVDHALLPDICSYLFKRLDDLLDQYVKSDENDSNQASWVCIILNECWSFFKMSVVPETMRYSPKASRLEKYWQLCLKQLNISDEAKVEAMEKEYAEETNIDAILIASVPWVTNDGIFSAKEDLCPEISQFLSHRRSVAKLCKHMTNFLRTTKNPSRRH